MDDTTTTAEDDAGDRRGGPSGPALLTHRGPRSPRGAARHLVFAYGSLAVEPGARRAQLLGHRRAWGVGMDNRAAIPGYKCYARPGGDGRPAVVVAFLDIVQDDASVVDGALIDVDDAGLRALDARERNYRRVDVTAHLLHAPGVVWAYRGTSAGRARLRAGLDRGRAVVHASYLETVRSGLAAHGIEDALEIGDGLRVMDLERVELPLAA